MNRLKIFYACCGNMLQTLFITAWRLHSNTLATPPASSWWCVLSWESKHHFFFELECWIVCPVTRSRPTSTHWTSLPLACAGLWFRSPWHCPWPEICAWVCVWRELPFWTPGLSVSVKKRQHWFAWFQVGGLDWFRVDLVNWVRLNLIAN